ncbi:MAG: hypothetical protein U0P46_12770 [Holophagaceae bacterium]
MHRNHLITHAILWAAAILASALVGAPAVLSTLLLPTLAIASLLFMGPRLRAVRCPSR